MTVGEDELAQDLIENFSIGDRREEINLSSCDSPCKCISNFRPGTCKCSYPITELKGSSLCPEFVGLLGMPLSSNVDRIIIAYIAVQAQ